MIVINKDSNTTFVLGSLWTGNIATPYYLFELKNEVTYDTVCFIAADTSTAQERYSEFTVTETSGTPIYTSGTIELEPTGTWLARVFEQTSSTNLNPSLASNNEPLKTFIVKVRGTEVSYDRNNSTDITYDVNEPQ